MENNKKEIENNQHQKLLSICIPTYNRAKYLDLSLQQFFREFQSIDKSKVELFVSDNASPDITPEVVEKYIQMGLPIVYNRNEKNLGPDGNFILCFRHAKSKYVWLLGDDDYLKEGALSLILDVLERNDVGLLHTCHYKLPKSETVFDNPEKALVQAGVLITFMSASIMRSDAVERVEVNDALLKCNLLQVPFYIESALMWKKVVMIRNTDIFLPQDINAGVYGYNFFKVFIENYLNIWDKFYRERKIQISTYKSIKKQLLWNYVLARIVQIYIYKQYPGLQKEGAFKIIMKYYGKEPFFYLYLIKIPLILFRDFVMKVFAKSR